MSAQPITPPPTACPKCGYVAAQSVCTYCKTLKPEWYAAMGHKGDRAVGIATALACIFIAAILSGVIA